MMMMIAICKIAEKSLHEVTEKKAIAVAAPRAWNNLSSPLRHVHSVDTFTLPTKNISLLRSFNVFFYSFLAFYFQLHFVRHIFLFVHLVALILTF